MPLEASFVAEIQVLVEMLRSAVSVASKVICL